MKKKEIKDTLKECEPSFAEAVKKGKIKYPEFCLVAPKDPTINWWRALTFPWLYGGWDKLANYSSSWVSCACGNQCIVIPRNEYSGFPLDRKLKTLGVDFHGAVIMRHAKEAKEILTAIELRSAELIQEIEFNKQYEVQM